MSSIDAPTNVLNAVSIFVRVAELKSFTGAAKKLGITASGASKAVTRLEAKLGVQLAKRTTRSVSLTAEGAVYADRCRRLLLELEEAGDFIAQAQAEPAGPLRVQLPAAEGRSTIIPALPRFMDAHPKLTIEIELSGRPTDLQDETVDCAVRIGPLPDSRLIARRICDLRYVVCGSPAYLKAFGSPKRIDDLKRHRCLGYLNPLTGRYADWEFLVDDQLANVPIRSSLSASGIQTLVDAAVADAGLVQAPTAVVAAQICNGALIPVLTDIPIPTRPMNFVYLPNRQLSPRVRVFSQFLSDLIPRDPPWDRMIRQHLGIDALATERA